MDTSFAGPSRFLTTRWSVVAAAGSGEPREAAEALEQLAEAYWYPLYAYARRAGNEPDRARDLVQGLFMLLLERGDLTSVAPDKGRFRAFLLTALRNHELNQLARERALKRGGDRRAISIDAAGADTRYGHEPSHELTPERLFERTWALSVLDRAQARVELRYRESGQSELFERLRPSLGGQAPAPAHAELAADLGMTEGAVKVALHRLRKRFGTELRAEIAETVADPAEVDAEVRHLFEALAPNSADTR